MRYSLILALVVVLLSAPTVAPGTGVSFSQDEFARRRGVVLDAIGPNAIAVIKGNEGVPAYKEFRQDNTFYYLTGVEVPGATLLLEGSRRRAVLFLPERREAKERMEGPVMIPGEPARQATGIPEVLSTTELGVVLQKSAIGHERLFTPMVPMELGAYSRDVATQYNTAITNDPWDGRSSREQHFVTLLRERLPNASIADLTPIIDRMRQVKSVQEIALIRKATELAAAGLTEAMRSTQPGQYEYEIDALAQFVFLRNGAQGMAYYAIVASGQNAWYPHYHANSAVLKSGDLVLMDFAPDYRYYVSDVTRMWPVSGKFTGEQRQLYGFYLDCYKAILRNIRPRVPVNSILARAADDMELILARQTFTNERHRQAARNFVADYRRNAQRPGPGSLGHWIGMSAHDVGSPVDSLQPGMTFTIEPQFKVPEVKLYFRLEDALLVTDTGVENMSAMAPIEMNAIEAVMKEEGILERSQRLFPRESMHSGRQQLHR